MEIKFFDTLAGKAREFKPLEPGKAKIYTCGPTVYDYAHIGNFRAFVFEDLLRRFLEASAYEVTHVMNLTDVDDKTIAGAEREKVQLDEYTSKYIQAFNDDLKALNCLAPSIQPRATREVTGKGGMIELIQTLIQKEAAYESAGSVYFRVSKFPDYGKLSKKKLEMNIAGASERVDADEYDSKEKVSDFVLWKASKKGEVELMASWDSPWGKGRPGWHIECSSMSMKYLGETFDIHAGGEDLIFPHHENEIAQSEGASGKAPFVNYWLHCKFLLVNGEKMSKSKGNFYTLRDLLGKGYDPMAIRYALLSTHYRNTLNFTFELLKEGGDSVKKLDDAYWQCVSRLILRDFGTKETGCAAGLEKVFKNVMNSLADDLNVSAAFSELLAGVSFVNSNIAFMNESELAAVAKFFRKVDQLLGLNVTDYQDIPAEILKLAAERAEVRKGVKADKELWKKSDELRDKIQALGWTVKDGKPGELSTLKKKRRTWD
jgi:cysteinyl-tRNA synthetase